MPGERQVDLVLEGGGVKAIGLVGALEGLEAASLRAERFAGTSGGAIVGALAAAGYSGDELRDLVLGLDFLAFADRGWEDRVPLVGEPLSLLRDLGLWEGRELERVVAELLAARGVRTFADLTGANGDPRLRVIASDVTARRMLVLPGDATSFGVEPARLHVAEAVRMSACLPVFFEPVRRKNPDTGREHLVVDGGLFSNFPLWIFDDEPQRPTIGLLLAEPAPETPVCERLPPRQSHRSPLGMLLDYAKDLAATVMEAQDRRFLREADFARTVLIPTLGIGTTEFDLPAERRRALYESGRRAAEEFLERWRPEALAAAFPPGQPAPSRREALEALLDRPPRA